MKFRETKHGADFGNGVKRLDAHDGAVVDLLAAVELEDGLKICEGSAVHIGEFVRSASDRW